MLFKFFKFLDKIYFILVNIGLVEDLVEGVGVDFKVVVIFFLLVEFDLVNIV